MTETEAPVKTPVKTPTTSPTVTPTKDPFRPRPGKERKPKA